MSKEYRAKVFKSGNSVALRLPKALGLRDGDEMVLREEQRKFTFEPIEAPKRKITGEGWMGAAPGLKPLTRDEREFDDDPRPWDAPDWTWADQT